MRIWTVVAILGLSACGISTDRERFPDQLQEAQCRFDKACYRAEFFYDHVDVKDCVDESAKIWADVAPEYEDCSFNEDKAAECLEWFNRSCKVTGKELDQLRNDCEAVWRCD